MKEKNQEKQFYNLQVQKTIQIYKCIFRESGIDQIICQVTETE